MPERASYRKPPSAVDQLRNRTRTKPYAADEAARKARPPHCLAIECRAVTAAVPRRCNTRSLPECRGSTFIVPVAGAARSTAIRRQRRQPCARVEVFVLPRQCAYARTRGYMRRGRLALGRRSRPLLVAASNSSCGASLARGNLCWVLRAKWRHSSWLALSAGLSCDWRGIAAQGLDG
jgi:hypothetical protein